MAAQGEDQQLAGLRVRAEGRRELCGEAGQSDTGVAYAAIEGGAASGTVDGSVFVCPTCHGGLDSTCTVNAKHWDGLKESIWSVHTVVKVAAFHVLQRRRTKGNFGTNVAKIKLDRPYGGGLGFFTLR